MTASAHPPARWKKLSETKAASTRIFDLCVARYRHPGRGIEKDFSIVRAPEWVNIIALTPKHELVLVNQFRFGIDALSLEIPGGMAEAGEDPVEAGLRELREETGYVGSSARLIGWVHPNPAFQTNRCHFLLVENVVRSTEVAWDADEEIEVLTAPVEEVYQWARSGKITHSLVLTALFFFETAWAKLNSPKASQVV